MNRKIKVIANSLLAFIVALLLVNCTSHPQSVVPSGTAQGSGISWPQPVVPSGTAQGAQAFRSNGERIYFSSTSDRGTNITYTGGPSYSGMMGNSSSGGMMGNGNGNPSSGRTGGGYGGMMGNGSSGGMMGNGNGNPSSGRTGGGYLTCASCHGADGRGGVHTMMGMQTMNAPDIRWSALKNEFDAEKFRLAVTKGQDPDGTQLKQDMPRWNLSNEDLADLIAYLKTLT